MKVHTSWVLDPENKYNNNISTSYTRIDIPRLLIIRVLTMANQLMSTSLRLRFLRRFRVCQPLYQVLLDISFNKFIIRTRRDQWSFTEWSLTNHQLIPSSTPNVTSKFQMLPSLPKPVSNNLANSFHSRSLSNKRFCTQWVFNKNCWAGKTAESSARVYIQKLILLQSLRWIIFLKLKQCKVWCFLRGKNLLALSILKMKIINIWDHSRRIKLFKTISNLSRAQFSINKLKLNRQNLSRHHCRKWQPKPQPIIQKCWTNHRWMPTVLWARPLLLVEWAISLQMVPQPVSLPRKNYYLWYMRES